MGIRIGLSSIMGLGLNRILTNIKVLPSSIYFRWPLRIITFLLPNALFYPAHYGAYLTNKSIL